MTLLTLGESLICFDSGEDRLDAASRVRKYVVGAESNVAIGLARLGRSVAYIGRVGTDAGGREIVRTLRGEGVDVSGVRTVADLPTAVLIKEQTAPGRVGVTYHRRHAAGATLSPADIPQDFSGIRRLHVTGITLVLSASARDAALEAMQRARGAGARVSLDANFRRTLASDDVLVREFENAAALADEVFLGRGEAALCAGTESTPEQYAQGLDVETVVLKGGNGGATAFFAGDRISVEAEQVPVVDPVGSGDGFVVGYLDTMLSGGTIADALSRGAKVAARVIGCRGDYQGLPYEGELDDRRAELAVTR
ncbi:sugar kinase [Microbacterium sp. NIBRBAC000506063]|uniref:sugar kinase n=1 Tax=Microbacterium sp. NIBRBAC000506063 TaxID=2734618 RepID=UPI001BB54DDA|nr:sugar kinase [Microbacterium sp. NIBRBAC000506063]QTV80389.1 sugar kinase [Microbacterium sp. NIBRBAC000506063]